MLAVDLQSDPPLFDEENRTVDSEEVVKMCGSIVRLDTNAQGLHEIPAAHTSVIDFLTTQPVKIGLEEVVRFSKRKSTLRMAEACLVYLRNVLDNDISSTEDKIKRYPFAQLSALTWDDCYREALASPGREDMARLNGLVMDLFSSRTATLNCINLTKKYKNTDWAYALTRASRIEQPIHLAACYGLSDIVQNLISEGYPVDGVFGPGLGTPLVAACAMGRTNVVSLLLDRGADPNLSSHFHYGTPMVAAIEHDQIEIVHLLLRAKGIDLNGRRLPLIEDWETERLERGYGTNDRIQELVTLIQRFPTTNRIQSSSESMVYVAIKNGTILLLSEALDKTNPDPSHRMAGIINPRSRSTARLEPGPIVPKGVTGP